MVGIAKGRLRIEDFAKQLLAFDQRRLAQVNAVAIQDVEGVVDDRRAVHHRLRHAGDIHSGLRALEAAAAFLVEDDDLAVDQRLFHAEPIGQCRQLGVVRGDVAAGAGEESALAVFHLGQGADAVPLHLEDPLGVGKRLGGQSREHRPGSLRHGSLDGPFQRSRLRPRLRAGWRQVVANLAQGSARHDGFAIQVDIP